MLNLDGGGGGGGGVQPPPKKKKKKKNNRKVGTQSYFLELGRQHSKSNQITYRKKN